MRRLATVFTALILSPAPVALGLAPPPAAVAATITTILAGSQPVDGGYQILVRLWSDQAIERVQATIRHPGGGTTTIDGFDIVQRTATVWEATSTAPVAVTAIGDHAIDVSAWDASGARTDRAGAGTISRRLQTRFDGVTVTPTKLDILEDEVTVSGRLLRRTTDGTEEPFPGATITVHNLPYTFVTDAQGAFSGKIHMGGVGSVVIGYATGPVYSGTATQPVPVTYRQLQTRVSLIVPPQSPRLLVGGTFTASGTLERQRSNGVWEPFGDRLVDIWFSDHETQTEGKVAEARTGPDGRYSVPVTVTGSGQYMAYFNYPLSDRMYGYSGVATWALYALYPTQVTGSDATPEPVGAGSKVTLRGQIIRRNAPADRTVPAGVYVELEFSPDGKQWQNVGFGKADAQGRVTLSATASKDGYWRAHYPGEPAAPGALTLDAPANGAADYVDVRYSTRMSSFNASPEPVTKGKAITVQGRLDRLVGSWKPAAAGAVIAFYFKPTGATSWTSMGSVKTSSTGWYKKAFTASKDGTWMVKYAGSGTYLASQSPGDYVDVR